MNPAEDAAELLLHFGIRDSGEMASRSPIDGSVIGHVSTQAPGPVAAHSADALRLWRNVPAPRRGELVRLLGEELRAEKSALARLVTLESGKILQEGLGEVQEMIDICD